MKNILIYLLFAVSGVITSCIEESFDTYQAELISLTDFDDGTMDGWIAGFAQYPIGLEDSFRLSHKIGDFITSSSESKCVILRGKSWNNDLFMFVKGEIGGFDKDSFYDVFIDVELYSELIETYDGGLEPQVGSYLKVGAMTDEPAVTIMPYFNDQELMSNEMDIDIGIENEGSSNVENLGRLVYTEAGFEPIVLRGFNSDNPIRVKTNSEGKLWLLVGIDNNVLVYQDVYINFIGARYGKVIF